MLPEGLVIDTFEGSAYIGIYLVDINKFTSPYFPLTIMPFY